MFNMRVVEKGRGERMWYFEGEKKTPAVPRLSGRMIGIPNVILKDTFANYLLIGMMNSVKEDAKTRR